MDVFDQIAAGLRPAPPPSAPRSATPPSLPEAPLQYALAKQVPAMARGFAIATDYGDITIPPGWMADRIALHVQRVLQVERMAVQEGNA